MTLWAWSSVMRNSAFRTETTNSRGVKSSLTRMTLCRRGRSVLVRTLVFGLVTVSVIPAAPPDARGLIEAEYRVRGRGGTGCLAMASLQAALQKASADAGGSLGEIKEAV